MSFVTKVDEANFEAEVLKSDKIVLIDFYADWCGPCKAMTPALEEFAKDNADKIKVVKINVDDNRNLAAAFQVRSIPTLVTMKDGQALVGTVGALPKSGMEKLVEATLQKLSQANINPKASDSKPPKI